METKEDPRLEENEQDSTLQQEERESEDALDLDDLFADEDDSQEEELSETEQLKAEIKRLEKGIKTLAERQGREKNTDEKQQTKTESKSNDLDDVSEMFFTHTPVAELVSDDIKTIADAKYNGSVIKAWRNEKWLQDKANSLDSARKEEEANRAKVSRPANGTGSSKVDIRKVKEEDVKNLPPDKKNEWLRMQARLERESDE